MAKISQLTATTSPADTDSLPIENSSGTITTKRITISSLASTIANKVRSLLSIGSASSLKTSSKEIVGAVNEVHDSIDTYATNTEAILTDHQQQLNWCSDNIIDLQDSVSSLNTKSQWRAQNTTGTNVITIPSDANEAVVFVFEESRSVSYTFFLPKPILNGQNITISQGYGWSDAENKNVCQILVGFNKVHVAAIYNAGNNFVDTCVMDVYWR